MLPNPRSNNEQILEALTDMSNLIFRVLTIQRSISFPSLASQFECSEAVIHKSICALGCEVDEDTRNFIVVGKPSYSPRQAAKRFISGRESDE